MCGLSDVVSITYTHGVASVSTPSSEAERRWSQPLGLTPLHVGDMHTPGPSVRAPSLSHSRCGVLGLVVGLMKATSARSGSHALACGRARPRMDGADRSPAQRALGRCHVSASPLPRRTHVMTASTWSVLSRAPRGLSGLEVCGLSDVVSITYTHGVASVSTPSSEAERRWSQPLGLTPLHVGDMHTPGPSVRAPSLSHSRCGVLGLVVGLMKATSARSGSHALACGRARPRMDGADRSPAQRALGRCHVSTSPLPRRTHVMTASTWIF